MVWYASGGKAQLSSHWTLTAVHIRLMSKLRPMHHRICCSIGSWAMFWSCIASCRQRLYSSTMVFTNELLLLSSFGNSSSEWLKVESASATASCSCLSLSNCSNSDIYRGDCWGVVIVSDGGKHLRKNRSSLWLTAFGFLCPGHVMYSHFDSFYVII